MAHRESGAPSTTALHAAERAVRPPPLSESGLTAAQEAMALIKVRQSVRLVGVAKERACRRCHHHHHHHTARRDVVEEEDESATAANPSPPSPSPPAAVAARSRLGGQSGQAAAEGRAATPGRALGGDALLPGESRVVASSSSQITPTVTRCERSAESLRGITSRRAVWRVCGSGPPRTPDDVWRRGRLAAPMWVSSTVRAGAAGEPQVDPRRRGRRARGGGGVGRVRDGDHRRRRARRGREA